MSDFKAGFNHNDNSNNPPTYSESMATSPFPAYDERIASAQLQTSSSLNTNTNPLHPQFQSLIQQIKLTQTQTTKTYTLHLQNLISILTAQIDPFFTSFSSTGLTKGTLYLIPSGCVSREAKLADLDLRARDEFIVVEQVGREKGQGGTSWWKDEGLARELVSELMPRNRRRSNAVERNEQRLEAITPLSNTNGAKSSWWNSRKSISPIPVVRERQYAAVEKSQVMTSQLSGNHGEGGKKADVDMKVTAEEVVFRSQNGFGIWSSERGFAVVMRFVVTLGS